MADRNGNEPPPPPEQGATRTRRDDDASQRWAEPQTASGHRTGPPALRVIPGKGTRTSKLMPHAGAQRPAADPHSAPALTTWPSPAELTDDPWMDAAHRGLAAWAGREHLLAAESAEPPGRGQSQPSTPVPAPDDAAPSPDLPPPVKPGP